MSDSSRSQVQRPNAGSSGLNARYRYSIRRTGPVSKQSRKTILTRRRELDNRRDLRSKRPDWTERLARLASLVGSILALIAALGFPAASLQYFRLGIPLQFLSYDRALRAGILPTVVLTFLVAGLSSIGHFAGRRVRRRRERRHDTGGEVPPVLVPFFIVLWLLGVAFWLALFVGTIAMMAFPFAWLARSFGLIVMFIALAVLVAINVVIQRWFWKKDKLLEPDLRQRGASALRPYFEGQPFTDFGEALILGAYVLGAMFALSWALRSLFDVRSGIFSTTNIWILAVALGIMAYIATFAFFSLPAFSSHSKRKRLLARAELVVLGILVYAFFTWLYADKVYVNIPQFLGGGRPEAVIAEISFSNSQIDLSLELPAAQCSRRGMDWICTNLYLVNARGGDWVVADTRVSYGDALLIPRSYFTVIQGRS